MEHAFLHKLARVLWRALVAAIILLAVYVSLGRLAVDAVGQYQPQILAELNRSLPFEVHARQVSGSWRTFSPELVLSDLQLRLRDQPEVVVHLGEGRLRLAVLRSLLDTSVQVSRLELAGLALPLVLDADGRLRLAGFSGGNGELGRWLRELLLNIEQLELSDNHLSLRLPGGERRALALDLALRRDGSLRELRANLRATDGDTAIDLVANTLGNPFALETLEGEGYLRATGADLEALSAWLPPARRSLDARGVMDIELWLGWRDGEPDLRTRVAGRGLRLAAADGRWQLPLDTLGFEASVKRRDNSWSLFTRELELAQGAIALQVPRLQLDLWGDSLRLRGEQVPLGPVSALVAGFPATPQGLAAALQALDARGELGRLEFSLDDLHAPSRGWQLAANFSDFAVHSWRGAPGMRSGAGFVHLAPGQGQVILDSRQFSMDFPTVYDHALDYDEIHGTVNLAWDRAALALHSGLITSVGEEGTSHALFGLQVPFSETPAGIEMDLLVGLRQSRAGYRHKYLPAVLDPRLLDWLRDSLGEGAVEQGAFLWRGSLRASAAELRTVQLFFDVTDTSLRYHPDWPALSALDGLVLIDDTDVSVWADRARLYDSALSRLSAEAWKGEGEHMHLAVAGEMRGSAADALRLVRESPLSGLSGGVFDTWSASGEQSTRLDLELILASDAPPPRVRVSTTLADTVLAMTPLGLTVEEVAGTVDYDSAAGFSSRDLRGRLWQQPVTAHLRQGAGGKGGGTLAPLDVALAGTLPAPALQQWLGLAGPALATGSARASARLRFPAGAAPTLHLDSSLQGLALNLPQPLGKSAKEALPLDLSLTLAGDQRRLKLALERRLDLDLLLGADWHLQGGEIALQERAAQPRTGRLRLGGHTPRLDTRRWRELLQGLAGGALPAAGAAQPPLSVQGLLVDTLSLEGVELSDVLLGGQQRADGGWALQAETPWMQGELLLEAGRERGQLHLRHLDLAGLATLGGGGDGGQGRGRLPALAVTIDALSRAGRPLGNLRFDLRSTPWALRAAGITGALAGLTLSPEAPGELLWQYGTEARTSLSARLEFTDLGRVLEALDYERILDTERGHFDLALEWPGGPQDFALVDAAGRLGIDIDGGRFLDAPAGTAGTLRVVSILNLAEIVRRLSLTHMFAAGIPFDRVDGELFFHRGTLEVPRVVVDGAASSFSFSGVSAIDTRSLDGELVATLPVANNLPWVAALTAGLPVAAGVYVVSKVFEQQMNRMTSAVYRIDGSWDEPEVKFDRLFDTGGDGPKGPPEEAAPDPGEAPAPGQEG